MFIKNIKIKHWLVLTSLATCIVAISVFSYLLVIGSYNQNEALASSYTREQIITAINKKRAKQNLLPLIQNEKLNKSAQAKSDDMSNPDASYFSHISPRNKKWSNFINEYNYEYTIAGENLANGYISVDRMVEAWMKSTSHRENILNSDFIDTGVGIAYGKLNQKPTIFVTQHFGKL